MKFYICATRIDGSLAACPYLKSANTWVSTTDRAMSFFTVEAAESFIYANELTHSVVVYG